MAGIIESVQKKKNPYAPMEAMQGPNGVTAPESGQTAGLAKPAPAPGPVQTAPAPYAPPESPDMAMPIPNVGTAQPYRPPNDVQPSPQPVQPGGESYLPPGDVQPDPGIIDSRMPRAGVPTAAPVLKGEQAPNSGAANEMMLRSVQASEPMKAEGSSKPAPGVGSPEPMKAEGASDPNSIEAQMEEARKRLEAQTSGSGAPAPGGGVLGSGLLSDGGTGTDYSKVGTTDGQVAGAPGSTAWDPTKGIVDQIKGIDPQTVTGTKYDPTAIDPTQTATSTGFKPTGYDATKAPEAVGANVTGYDAGGYDAAQTKENLSGAVNRITSDDGIIMQRQKAAAAQAANDRGMLNSSMAVQAGQAAVLDKATEIGAGDVQAEQFNVGQKNDALRFSADARNTAAQFLAGAKNTASMALAAEQNQNGRFNAQQANEASQFTANAKNQADAFLAAAQNNASIFNAGEANKRSLASAEFANQAKQFAAQMEQASKEFNATAYNQAQQRYVDSMNAAIAAQNDAENLARRDTAQINADLTKTKMGLGVQQQISAGNNAASIASARIGSETALETARIASRDRQAALDQSATQFGLQLSQQDRQFVSNLSATQFNQFQSGLNAGMLSEMEPEARQNWMHNYMSVWSATSSLPFNIDMSMFPPSGTPPGGTPTTGPGSPGTTNPVGR